MSESGFAGLKDFEDHCREKDMKDSRDGKWVKILSILKSYKS